MIAEPKYTAFCRLNVWGFAISSRQPHGSRNAGLAMFIAAHHFIVRMY